MSNIHVENVAWNDVSEFKSWVDEQKSRSALVQVLSTYIGESTKHVTKVRVREFEPKAILRV